MDMRFSNVKFFSYIRTQFGIDACKVLKEFIKLTDHSINLRIRIKFLNDCYKLGLVPQHLDMRKRYEYLGFFHKGSKRRLKDLCVNFVKTVLRLELNDAHRQLITIRNNIYKMYKKMLKLLPECTLRRFFDHQERNNRIKWIMNMNRIKKKIDWLVFKHNEKVRRDIKPINYYFDSKGIKEGNFSQNDNAGSLSEIKITPMNFALESSLEVIHDRWFVNLSKKNIPEDVIRLLQLGEKFSLPIVAKDNDRIIIDFIKCIEKNLFNEMEVIGNSIRNQSVPIIKRVHNIKNNCNDNHKMLIRCLNCTKKFVKENPDILFTRADKGNATVAMDLSHYKNSMKDILSDSNTYIVMKKDPIKKLFNSTKSLLSGWLKHEYIDNRLYRRMLTTDGVLPRAYGLPKLHKKDYPLRVIISSLKSPLYELACYLHETIKSSVMEADSSVGNSFNLVKKLDGKLLEPGYTFASLDVISLFTNVPIEYAYDAIVRRWILIERNTAVPMNEFMGAIRLVLESTFFLFDNTVYRQVFGTPMGSPLSPIIADLVLRDLERKAIEKLPISLPIYYRYVDDILLAAPTNQLENILTVFNSFHKRLQFTLEISSNDRINFLDVTIFLDDRKIMFDKFERATNTGRYINFHSQHPLSHKRGIVYGLIDRIILLSHPSFHEKNIMNAVHILLKNCYPLPFIFATINKRLRMLINRRVHNVKKKNELLEITQKNFFTIPYLKSVSESFLPVIKKHGYDIAFSVLNTLNKFIKRGKDTIDRMSQNDCVYKIDCLDCDMSYVGQTKRRLCTRIKEHLTDINKKNGLLSVVSNHRLNCDHEMNWSEIAILDKESSYTKRIVSEMVHIKRQKRALNKQSDTDLLPDAYLPIIGGLLPS